jgi:hypothetical protein
MGGEGLEAARTRDFAATSLPPLVSDHQALYFFRDPSKFLAWFFPRDFAFPRGEHMARARLALLALLVAAAPIGAQEVPGALVASVDSPSVSAASVTPVTNGPTLAAARRAARPLENVARPATPLAPRIGLGQARAMMIVGGAALLAGAIIGDDAGAIVMVGGAIVGLVGLYEYLQ